MKMIYTLSLLYTIECQLEYPNLTKYPNQMYILTKMNILVQ